MLRSVFLACGCGLLLLLAGCSTYSAGAEVPLRKLKTGDPSAALRWSGKLTGSARNRSLGLIERGRIRMLEGDFSGSSADFTEVIDTLLEETESGPVIRAGAAGSSLVAATVADDTIRGYTLPPYEQILLLHYQTLNHLFSGDPEKASVEMRRTVFLQDAVADKGPDLSREPAHGDALAALQPAMDRMAPVLERTRSASENGLAWYLCGVIFEKQGDEANAALCYRKARELAPENQRIQQDFLRLLQKQDPAAYAELAGSLPAEPPALQAGSAEVIVLYEEALISRRQAEKIPIPVPDFRGAITLIAIDFAVYGDPAYSPSGLPVVTDDQPAGQLEPAVYVQSLAFRDLKDKIPGMVARNVTRAATKIAIQQAANNQNAHLMRDGVMIANAVASLLTTADTRGWYSLPMVARIYRGELQPGAHRLECRSPLSGSRIQIPLHLMEGETRIIWIADTGGMVSAADASLDGKGLPPAFRRFYNSY